jgi:hypothetical protein
MADEPSEEEKQRIAGEILKQADAKTRKVIAEQARLMGSRADTEDIPIKVSTMEGGRAMLTFPGKERELETSTGIGKSPAMTHKLGREADQQIRMESIASMASKIKDALGKSVPQAIEQVMEEMCPELLAKFYPRIYEATGRYHSPKNCAAFITNTVAESLRLGYERTPTAYRLLIPALEPMAQRRMPMFFIAPELLEAIERSDFADDIDWTEIQLPYEQGIFILPRGSFVHPEDGDVSMIIWGRFEAGDYPPPALGLPVSQIPGKSMTLLALCPERAIWYDSVLTAAKRRTIQLHNLFYRAPGEPSPQITRSHPYLDDELTEQDEGFLDRMGAIAFGTLLAMNAKPELLERGKLLRKVVKGEKTREFWSPNVIGARYKLKREVPRIVGGKFVQSQREGGTHASPRMHWRRGHFRQQPYGVGLRERRTVWIEPMLIGAAVEEK